MTKTTTALVVREFNAPFKLETITLDDLRPDEALVEIHATGVCHTDLKSASGAMPASAPAVFGHEGAGVVIEAGSEVQGVRPGDKVILSYPFCGNCAQCTSEDPAYCDHIGSLLFGGRRADGSHTLFLEDGSPLNGHFFGQSSFSRLAIVHRNSLNKVPQDTPLELFAPLGCGIQTGVGAVLNVLDVKPGSDLAVFGVGSVGLSAVMAAKIREAGKIIAVDISLDRLELAKELGATHTILSSETTVKEIKELCPPNGVKYAVDCAGFPSVVQNMVDSLGIRGRGCTVGSPGKGPRAGIEIASHLLFGRQYVGTHQGDSISREMIPWIVAQHADGKFPLEKLITYYDIRDHERAFSDLKDGKAIKAVFRWNA